MTKQINGLLTFENVFKLCSLIVIVVAQHYANKSDVRDLATQKHYEVEHLQYQITELKDCCNDRQTKRFAFKQSPAILPHEIEMRDE